MATDKKVRDPVCGMLVDADQLPLIHLQIPFAFCSNQCRERFKANPGLYTGRPGQKSPVQRGQTAVKHRTMRLDQPIPATQAAALRVALMRLMGVKSAEISANQIDVSYDLLQITAEQIEVVITSHDLELDEGWTERLHRAWVHAVEEDQISSMEVPQSVGSQDCH